VSRIVKPGSLRRVRHRYMPTMLHKRHQRDFEGAFCLTCLHPVDSEEMVEGYGRDEHGRTSQYPYVKILYRCHGAEELVQFDFDTTDWDDRDLIRMVQRHRFFSPTGHADEGRLLVQVVK